MKPFIQYTNFSICAVRSDVEFIWNFGWRKSTLSDAASEAYVEAISIQLSK